MGKLLLVIGAILFVYYVAIPAAIVVAVVAASAASIAAGVWVGRKAYDWLAPPDETPELG